MSQSKTAAEQSLYDSLNRYLDQQDWGAAAVFLNYGYLPNGAGLAQFELPKDAPGRNSARLVLETIGDCPVDNQDLLEVGCGRGGTLATVRKFFKPRSVTGIDLSAAAIGFCRAQHDQTSCRFAVGDAENLPLKSESCDVVINIESACCYPRIENFYRQVHRVLRPGGHFLYTDNIASDMLETRLQSLRQYFRVEQFREITENVLLSCDEIAARRLGLINSAKAEKFMAGIQHDAKPKHYEELIAQLLCVPGTKNYERMKNRLDSYVIVKLSKP